MGAGGETLAVTPPRIPEPGGVWQEISVSRLHSRFSHTARKQKQNLFPDTIQPTAIHWYPPPTLLRTRDILRLTSNRLSSRFVLKYQCISPGVVPKHHAPYNTPFIRSFFAFLFYIFVFFYKSSSILHTWFCPFLFRFNNQSVRLFPGAHGGTGYGAKWHALAGTHSPPISCRARSTRKLFRTQHIPSTKLRPAQRCLFMCRARWSDLEKHLEEETAREKVKNKVRQGPPKP